MNVRMNENANARPRQRRKTKGGFFKPGVVKEWKSSLGLESHVSQDNGMGKLSGTTASGAAMGMGIGIHRGGSVAENEANHTKKTDAIATSSSSIMITSDTDSSKYKAMDENSTGAGTDTKQNQISATQTSSKTFIRNHKLRVPVSQSKSTTSKAVYPLSICSIQGKRQYMEDEYFTNQNGSFSSVMDGHGGSAVSRYLRQNLYARYLQAKTTTGVVSDPADVEDGESIEKDKDNFKLDENTDVESETDHSDYDSSPNNKKMILRNAKGVLSDKLSNGNITSVPTSSFADAAEAPKTNGLPLRACIDALKSAFEKIDAEVQKVSHWSFQGSTAVAVKLHKVPSSNKTVLVSANVGDSRAILSRAGRAIDLTRDHKPNDPKERQRIESLGGKVEWFGPVGRDGKPLPRRNKNGVMHGFGGVYRINRNLALSRAIGDRSELPFVSSKVDIEQIEIDEDKDEFVVLASDGLWDYLESQEVVDFCHRHILREINASNSNTSLENRLEKVRRKMSKFLVKEALRRGSMDNITVVIVWLSP